MTAESQFTLRFTVKIDLILNLEGVFFLKKFFLKNKNLLSYIQNQTQHLKIFLSNYF